MHHILRVFRELGNRLVGPRLYVSLHVEVALLEVLVQLFKSLLVLHHLLLPAILGVVCLHNIVFDFFVNFFINPKDALLILDLTRLLHIVLLLLFLWLLRLPEELGDPVPLLFLRVAFFDAEILQLRL